MNIKMVITALNIQGESTSDDMAVLVPEATILEATDILAQRDIGVVLVCDQGGGLVGVLSERDIIRGVSEHKDAALGMKVSDLMTANPVTCSPEDGAKDVIGQMKEGGFRHMPVIDDGKAVGMVSSTDVLNYLAGNLSAKERDQLWSTSFWV